MTTKTSINKQGQALGPKGFATRERLMKAAEQLLQDHSPLDLTAVAIAKQAKTSSATFYMYFDDVKDAFFSLSLEASDHVVSVMQALGSAPKTEFEAAARRMVQAFTDAYNRHRHILRYRNMEADRGDESFEKIRMRSYLKEIEVIADWIYNAGDDVQKPTRSDAFSLATVLHAGMERLASLDPQIVKNGVGFDRLLVSQARVIAQVLADTGAWGRLPIDLSQRVKA